jgi:hypothetical protein
MARKFKYQIKGTRGKRYRRLDIEGGSTTVINNTTTGDGAPVDEPFITHAAGSSELTNNRVLTASDSGWIVLSDAGVDNGALKVEIGQLEQNKLLGRANSAGTGVPQVITLGTGLSMTGDVLSSTGGGGGGGAPDNATYVVISNDATLTNERALAVSGELTITDAGANSNVTLSITADGVTLGMLQNIADGTVLGNNTGGSANPVAITVNTSHLSLATDGATGSGSKLGFATNGVGNTHIRQSAAFSVVGKATTGTGNVADITCAPDRILGRNASGDLGFAQLVTGQCADDQITYPKMQNISAASRLLGRGSAGGAGDPQELTVSTGLSISGTALSCTITQYTDEHAQDAVGTILVDSSEINFTYSDMTPSITASLIDGSIALARLASVATARFIGRVTTGTGVPEAMTGTQATTLLNTFTDSLKGLVPPSGGGTTNYLRADGTFAAPPGSGGGTPAGSNTQVQYNNAGAFGADSAFVFNSTDKKVTARIFNVEPAGSPASGDRIGTFRFGDSFYSGSVIEMYVTYALVENLFWGIGAGNASHAGASANIGIGRGALANINGSDSGHTVVGDAAGGGITGRINNTCIGAGADVDSLGSVDNAVAIGASSVAKTDGAFAIGARRLQINPTGEGCGTATLVGGTVTVFNNFVKSGTLIFVSRKAAGGTLGHLSIGTITDNTSFVINSSSASDTSAIQWMLVHPE